MFLSVNLRSDECFLEGPERLCREIEEFLSPFGTERLTTQPGETDFSLVMKDDTAGLIKEGELLYARPFPGGFMIRFATTITRHFVRGVQTDTNLLLHAASMEFEDRILVLCGQSNSGKTTSVEYLLPHARTFLSDEFTLVDFSREAIQPFPRPINSSEPGKNRSFFRWRRYVNRLNHKYYYGYPPREFYPQGPVGGNVTFVFLRRIGSNGELRPLSIGQGITRMLGAKFDSSSVDPMESLRDIKAFNPSFYEISWSEISELASGLRNFIPQ